MTSESNATAWVAAPGGRLMLIDLLRHAWGAAPGSPPPVPLNDDLQGFRASRRRRCLTPLLASYWYLVESRLECRWLMPANDQTRTNDSQEQGKIQ